MYYNVNRLQIGFWRPLREREEWADPNTPETITERIQSYAEKEYAYFLSGKMPSIYIDLSYGPEEQARAGVGSADELLKLLAEEGRANSERELGLPIPIPGSIDSETAATVKRWLMGGRCVDGADRQSTCRICGCPNGSTEYVRGRYVYPIGLWHYVADHRVEVPGLEFPLIWTNDDPPVILARR